MNEDLNISDVEIKKPIKSGKKKKEINIKFKTRTAVIIAAIIIVTTFLFAYKNLFFAAKVDGHFITRISVIKELESNSGKSALDSIIIKLLVDEEMKKNNLSLSDDEINEEIKKVEDNLKLQGQTLEQALSSNGMSKEIFKKQISFQKKIEKLIADKISVTDSDIDKYITDNKITIPKGEEDSFRNNIKEELKQQKFNTNAKSYIDSLKSNAKIDYYIEY